MPNKNHKSKEENIRYFRQSILPTFLDIEMEFYWEEVGDDGYDDEYVEKHKKEINEAISDDDAVEVLMEHGSYGNDDWRYEVDKSIKSILEEKGIHVYYTQR